MSLIDDALKQAEADKTALPPVTSTLSVAEPSAAEAPSPVGAGRK